MIYVATNIGEGTAMNRDIARMRERHSATLVDSGLSKWFWFGEG